MSDFPRFENVDDALAFWIGHNGEIEHAAVESVVGLPWKKLSESQRELVNLLFARNRIRVHQGQVERYELCPACEQPLGAPPGITLFPDEPVPSDRCPLCLQLIITGA